jgi:hypothetical protein
MGFPKYGGIGGKGGNVNVVAKKGKWATGFRNACFFTSIFVFSFYHAVNCVY